MDTQQTYQITKPQYVIKIYIYILDIDDLIRQTQPLLSEQYLCFFFLEPTIQDNTY